MSLLIKKKNYQNLIVNVMNRCELKFHIE